MEPKEKYDEIESQLEELDKKYLICELLGKPETQMENYTQICCWREVNPWLRK